MAPPAKIRIGDGVFLRDQTKKTTTPFVPAKVTNVQQGGARVTVQRASGGDEEVLDTAKSDIFPANEEGMTADDHCALIHLNEPSVLENTRLRYLDDKIYTYTGKILVAMNPFTALDIYGEDKMKNYLDKDIGARSVDPHVYAMGEACYKHVKRWKTPAALVMSGESGAGKTETTKHLMRYLGWRSESVSGGAAAGKLDSLADAILSTNPLLEAFGNAKTVRNNNSSRFGKMMRLHFEPSGAVAGAVIKTYLLEKSRAVAITDPERNYHIFYMLMASGPAAAKGPYLSGLTPEGVHMLNQSKCLTLTSQSDEAWYAEADAAMAKLAIAKEDSADLMRVLSALLALGNVTYEDDDSDHADVTNVPALEAAEELLGAGKLTSLLTTRTMQRGGAGRRASSYTIQFNRHQADAARDALIKSVYTHLFDWVVSKVNSFICGGDGAAQLPYVGLLDIFGFENFKHNSFEQLCINFANEKLQQFFLVCVFKTEEELHVKEGVPWHDIEFQDNQPCIELMEKPPNGILRLLDSICKTPNATEATFTSELNRIHAKDDFLAPTRKFKMRDEEGFIVRHYAGDVVYQTAAVIGKTTGVAEVPWLEKNNDTLQQEWLGKLVGSSVPLVAALFAEENEAALKAKKAASFSSVGKRFVNDLNSLLAELQSLRASFVRCVKPNMENTPRAFTPSMVLDQLRCSGVIEAVRVMLEAFPTRIAYEDIHGRYAPLMGAEIVAETGSEPAAFCEAIALACEVSSADYALGMTKLFLKAGCGTFLEDLAAMDPAVVVPLLTEKIAQAKRKRGAKSLVGYAVLGHYRRKRYAEQKRAAEATQHRIRTIKARREYAKWSKEREARLKKEAVEAAAKRAAEEAAAKAEAELKAKQEAERVAAEAAAKAAAEAAAAQGAAAEAAAKAAAEKAAAEMKAAQEQAMAEAKAAAEKEAETKLAAAMAHAEAEAEESAARDRAKFTRDISRSDLASAGQAAATEEVNASRARRASTANADAVPAARRKSVVATPAGDGGDGAEAADGEKKAEAEEFFEVILARDTPKSSLGIAVDLWDGEVTVGAITTNGPADTEGTLIQGDTIRAVGGNADQPGGPKMVPCLTIEEVTREVIHGGLQIALSVCRRPKSTVLATEVKMRMPSGEWEPFAFRLLSNRNIEFEKLSPPQYSGEIHARLAHSLALGEDNGEKVLLINTGHKTFEIKAADEAELKQWHLRLQEVIMLQEKVANVAHGWLLKEEAGGSSFKHFWFVLFSNGILMYFTDPNRANLGASLGFIPVEECKESTHSQKQHLLHITSSDDAWLLATNSKDNMLQWASSLHATKPTKVAKAAANLVLAQGWLDVPHEDPETFDEVFVRHWFVLKNTELALHTEADKKANNLSAPVSSTPVAELRSAYRAKGGVEYHKFGIVIETAGGEDIKLRAVGGSEMRQLLSTLNVHCIAAPEAAAAKPDFVKQKSVVRQGYLYKKSLKGVSKTMGKAWQRRWFVLEVETAQGEPGSIVKTGTLTYYHSNKDTKEGAPIPLHETKAVKYGSGKTKGTEHRITISEAKRDYELGCEDKALAESWVADLKAWIGLPRVEREHGGADGAEAAVVKSQWMEYRVEAYVPDEISDEELARSNTIQKTTSTFGRTFTLTGRKKKDKPAPAPEAAPPAAAAAAEDDEGEGESDDEEEEAFTWAFVAFFSDGTLRAFEAEDLAIEKGRLALGYLVQAKFVDDLVDESYAHAFRVKPESATSDAWLLCPDSRDDSADWIKALT